MPPFNISVCYNVTSYGCYQFLKCTKFSEMNVFRNKRPRLLQVTINLNDKKNKANNKTFYVTATELLVEGKEREVTRRRGEIFIKMEVKLFTPMQ